MHTQVSQESLDRVVLQVAISTVHLQAIVNDIKALVGGKFLGHSAVHGVVGVTGCDKICTMSNHQSGGLEVCSHSCELKLHILVSRDGFSKLLSALNVVSG